MAVQNKNRVRLTTTVYGAVLTALVVLLQVFIPIRFGTVECTLVLVPIVVGVALCGTRMGTWLGLVFGAVVMFLPGTAVFMQESFVMTLLLVLIKGIAAGVCAGLVYRLLANKNQYVAVMVAAVLCPTVNTGIFVLGGVLFFSDVVIPILLIVFFNFLLELGVNVVLAPVILRLIRTVKKD